MEIKLSGTLYRQIIHDLQSPHPHAEERVGFVSGRLGTVGGQVHSILLTNYHSIPDDQYLIDPKVGARIGSDALAQAMRTVYFGRSSREGIFHIHLHGHRGETSMSFTDQQELPALIPGFQSVDRDAAHGIIILSQNHGSGWVWPPNSKAPIQAETLSVIGTPIRVFRRGGLK